MTKVIIARGKPGSGKSLYLLSLAAANDAKIVVCSADDFFTKDGGDYLSNFNPAQLSAAHKYCFGNFVAACDGMHTKQPLIIAVSNTNTCLFEMAPYIMYAQLRGIDTEIHEVEVPDADATDYYSFNTHGVPLSSIQTMMERWEQSLPFWPPVTKVHALRENRQFGIGPDDEERPNYERLIAAV